MLRLLSLSLVVAAASACVTPGVNIVTLRPTPVLEPRGADRLVLVDGEGRRSGKEEVADLFKEVARGGFYAVDDRGDDGVKLVLAGKTATVEGSSKAPRDNELFVRIDVLAWEAAPAVIRQTLDDGTVVEEPGVHGRADLQITVADASGNVLVREKEYLGAADLVDDCNPQSSVPLPVCGALLLQRSVQEAARGALTGFLSEITPVRVTDHVRFDGGDPGQKKLLERSSKEPLSETEKALRRYIKKNEGNAIAHYNLGVTLDAQGRFEEAIEAYDKAMKIVARDGYLEARGNAVARLAAWERVYGARKKPETKTAQTTEAPTTATTTTTETPAPTAPPAP